MTDIEHRALPSGRRLAWVTLRFEEGDRFGEADLERMETVLDSLEGDGGVAGVVITGGGPSFCSGLRVDALDGARDRRRLQAYSRRAMRLLARISRSRRPFVAAVRGSCLDIGLEFALACHVTLAAGEHSVRFGLPQIELGLLPLADALRRLPARVGLEPALDLLVRGHVVGVGEAKRLGLVHHVVHPAGIEAAACAVVRGRAGGDPSVRERLSWRPKISASKLLRRKRTLTRWQQSSRAERYGLDGSRLTMLDLLAKVGGGAEDEFRLAVAFSEAAVGDAAVARVQTWLRARALEVRKPPEGVRAVTVRRLGIVGGGAVGADLGVSAATAGVVVRIREKAPRTLGRALARVDTLVGADADFERRTRTRARLSGGLELDGFSTMDLVLESVPEEVSVKRRVFAELEDCVRPDAVLATHPRATSVAEIGARMRHPERLVGVRFFRPLAQRPLCEVVRTRHTSARALATAVAFARCIKKTPVVVNDGPGFFTNRVLAAYLSHAAELVAEGFAIEDLDLGARRAGWPVGPLQLLDFLGLSASVRVGHVLSEALGNRYSLPPSVEAMAATDRTFYRVSRGGSEPEPDTRVLDLLGAPTRKEGDPDELADRLTLVAALEAVRCLQDGILLRPSDGDVAAVLGLGYPATRGGPFRHLAARGLAATRSRLAALEDRFGPRYRAPALLVELAQRGADFSALEVSPT